MYPCETEIIFQNKLSKYAYRLQYGEISVRLIKSNLLLKTLGIVESLKKVFY